MVPPASDRVPRARPYSGNRRPQGTGFRLRGCYPVPPAFPCRSATPSLCDCAGGAGPPGTRAPQRLVQQRPSAVTHARVWAVALSLAATRAISVDFSSSGYLDVSVPRVAPRSVWIRLRVAGHCPRRVPPFGNPRVRGRLRLTAAYRSLPRPSSTSCAKASTVCLWYLRFAPAKLLA